MIKATLDNEKLLKSYKTINQTFNAQRNSKTYREMKQQLNEDELCVLSALQRERAFNIYLLNTTNGTVNKARSGRRKTNHIHVIPIAENQIHQTLENNQLETLEAIPADTLHINPTVAPTDASTTDATIDATVDASLEKLSATPAS